MKTLILMYIICFLTACSAQKANHNLVITGQVMPGEKVLLLQNQDNMFKDVSVGQADSTGYFRLEYQPAGMGLFSLNTASSRKYVPLMVAPGEEITVDLTGAEPVFAGDASERNRLMQELRKQESAWQKQWPASYDDAASYRRLAENRYQAYLDFLKNTEIESEEVAGILAANAMVQHYSSLLKFPFMYQLIKGSTPELPEGYYSFLPEVDLSSVYLRNLGNTNTFLQELFIVMEERGFLKGEKDNYLRGRAELISDPRTRENYLLYVINAVELMGYNQNLGKQIENIKPFIVTPEGQAELTKLTGKYAEIAAQNQHFNAGQPASDFSGTDVKGKKHSLSDYKGKVVVVDVWNTGCKPCIAEIPFLKKLEKQFEGGEVVFISYSLDTNEDIWKQFLKAHQMEGNQWINTEAFKSDFAKNYNVRFIPRFMVFGKDGNIVDVYAPRPSNPRLAQLISEQINK